MHLPVFATAGPFSAFFSLFTHGSLKSGWKNGWNHYIKRSGQAMRQGISFSVNHRIQINGQRSESEVGTSRLDAVAQCQNELVAMPEDETNEGDDKTGP